MSDRVARLQYSDDGGHNWSNWVDASIGEVGEYKDRAVFTRLGSTRTRIFRIRVTSPRKRDLMGAVATLQGTTG